MAAKKAESTFCWNLKGAAQEFFFIQHKLLFQDLSGRATP